MGENAFSLRPRPLQKVVDMPPVFGVIFACVPFSEVGWDTYPASEKKAAHRGDSGFYCFYSVCGICFASVFSATNREKRSAATVFQIPFQYHRRSRTVSLLHFCCGFVTDCFFKKSYCRNWFCASATPATHFCQEVLSRMRSAFSR